MPWLDGGKIAPHRPPVLLPLLSLLPMTLSPHGTPPGHSDLKGRGARVIHRLGVRTPLNQQRTADMPRVPSPQRDRRGHLFIRVLRLSPATATRHQELRSESGPPLTGGHIQKPAGDSQPRR